jgi:UDP-glucose 4-epimerase
MIFASRKIGSFEILNLGSEDWISVKEIARTVCEELSLTPRLEFGSSDRGWEGDVPLMLLDISKVKRLGWKPKYDSQSAVKLTVRSLVNASAPPPRR